MEARFACGSMVLLFLFHTFLHIVQKCMKKNEIFHPAGGDINFRVRDRVTPGRSGFVAEPIVAPEHRQYRSVSYPG
jgi:hypothetical protein